jgi:hypothetical protein
MYQLKSEKSVLKEKHKDKHILYYDSSPCETFFVQALLKQQPQKKVSP